MMEKIMLKNFATVALEWSSLTLLSELLMSFGTILRPDNYFYLLFTMALYFPLRLYTMKLG